MLASKTYHSYKAFAVPYDFSAWEALLEALENFRLGTTKMEGAFRATVALVHIVSFVCYDSMNSVAVSNQACKKQGAQLY